MYFGNSCCVGFSLYDPEFAGQKSSEINVQYIIRQNEQFAVKIDNSPVLRKTRKFLRKSRPERSNF
jgi:hypothetical protein